MQLKTLLRLPVFIIYQNEILCNTFVGKIAIDTASKRQLTYLPQFRERAS